MFKIFLLLSKSTAVNTVMIILVFILNLYFYTQKRVKLNV